MLRNIMIREHLDLPNITQIGPGDFDLPILVGRVTTLKLMYRKSYNFNFPKLISYLDDGRCLDL